ncbi:MAG: GNAT family N-acetyltransferase [Lachnospiraceae bacterium]|nr:GNAT family N-acetyltransferase [Lachnospiraceae bacterium]
MIKIYKNAKQFLAEAQENLLKRESVSQLILANALWNGEAPCAAELMFGTVWKGEKMILAFCNCKPWNLIIHAIDANKMDSKEGQLMQQIVKEAVKELTLWLKENQIPLRGLNANGFLSEQFVINYFKEPDEARKNHSMDIMECRKLKEIPLAEGIYRTADTDDTDWVLMGCVNFHKEALGQDCDPESLREDIEKVQIGEKTLRILTLPDGTPVCMAKRTRKLINGIIISQVYTLPQYRGRGYAQTLIYKMCEEFFKEGFQFAALFVDKNNPISNHVYQKAGFEIIEDNYDYRFDGGKER